MCSIVPTHPLSIAELPYQYHYYNYFIYSTYQINCYSQNLQYTNNFVDCPIVG